MSNTVKLNTCPKCNAPIPAEAPQGLCPKCVLLGAATATEQGVPATATSEIPSIERIAGAFPQLEILELIGRGGMGFVFKARQPHLDRFVALKLLPDKLAKDAQFAERFNREGRVLAKLNHPNIVSIFDFGQTGGFYYLLMEYVDGVNLRQAMRAGRFSPTEALSIVPKVCEALQYAHEQGVLHRDIKPENILLDAKGRVKIADFGIAKLVGEDQPSVTLTNTGAALGTPHYMAPEQLEKPSTVDHRADIYSLGVVFYEMLTGELPIGRFAAPSSKTPVNASVDEIVFRTLEKDRERRFQSAGEMKTRVEHLTEAAVGSSVPHSQGTMPDVSLVKRPAQALVAVGIFNWVGSIIVMLVLTWGGLGQQFPLSSQELGVIGLLMMVFSSVILMAGLKMMHLQAYPLAVLGSVLAMFTTPGNIIGLPVGLWALITLRQPKVRAAFARPATRKEEAQRRGALQWVSAAVLVTVFGLIVLPNLLTTRQTVVPPSAPAMAGSLTDTNQPLIEVVPRIQLTFTSVELREESRARWLTIDFVEQVRGDCQNTFRYDANVPGFRAYTRKEAYMSDANADFPSVLHQRVLWKLPDSLPQANALTLRDLVAKEWLRKPTVIEAGDERVLFKVVVPDGGSLVTAVGVRLTSDDTSSTNVIPGLRPSRNLSPNPAEPVSSALEFRLVAADGDTATSADELPERHGDGRESRLRVLRTIMLDGSAVARAGFETELTGTVAIGVELTAEGTRQFGAITAANTGRRLAIVSHGLVLSAPIIHGPITGGELKISGSFSADEVRRLVATLNRQPAGLEFAPVVERTLPYIARPAGTLALDLDSGRFLTNQIPRPNQREAWDRTWDRIRASGADILGFHRAARVDGSVRTLNSFYLAAIEAPESAWDNLAAEEVGWNWALMRDASKQDTQPAAPTNAPGTFLFRTRENGFGLLQILPATNAAPDVKIRYKLVRGTTSHRP